MPSRANTFRFLGNVAWMTVFQASGYVLALLNLPYLTRTLGVANYGTLAFVIGVNAYLWLIIDWGFSLGATKDVAQAHGEPGAIRDIVWRTMTAKLLLAAVALAGLGVLVALQKVPSPLYLLLPGILNICGAVLSVDWLMQGMGRMGLFSLYSIAGRTLVVILTFALVHGPQDTWIACALQGMGGLIGGGAGFLVATRYVDIGRPRFPFRDSLRQILDYRHYFLSQSSWIAYTAAAPLLLTFVSGVEATGIFAGAERITRMVMAVTAPVAVVMYPRVSALVSRSRSAAAELAGILLAMQALVGIALSIGLMIFARPIVELALGHKFTASVAVLRWLALLPAIVGVGGTLSKQFLMPLGRSREVSGITISCAVIYLALLASLGRYMGPEGGAIGLVVAEALLSLLSLRCLWTKERDFTVEALQAAMTAPQRVFEYLKELTAGDKTPKSTAAAPDTEGPAS
jgi:PST family polysaccharide transporter